jgi:hypothetical protein
VEYLIKLLQRSIFRLDVEEIDDTIISQ